MEIRPILSALLRNQTGALLVAIQVALSLAILANALHVVGVRQAVASRPSGLAGEAELFYLTARPVTARSHAEQMAAQRQEMAALRAVGGVLAVAQVNQMPMSRSGTAFSVAADRRQVRPSAIAAIYNSPDRLIQTWGLTLREGRDFNAADVSEIDPLVTLTLPPTVIVTRALAAAAYPGADSVVGKPLYYGTGSDAEEARIVGVVERLQTTDAQLGERGEHAAILPMRTSGNVTLYTLRAAPGQRERVMREAEAALRKTTAAPMIVELRTVQEDRGQRYRNDIALAWMLVAVSALLLLVTASGIVGIASLWVAQRRRQIGVRRALGARRVDILRYFITENLMITSAGVAVGAPLALALNHLLVSQLQLGRLPPAYLLGGALTFWTLGVAAVYGPAWRAASISPASASRGA